ncbi:MAG TPA: VWA domain-containing protein [Vicinamibacterales bacterium]|jgi:VWFA-related protein|nr:VWA domain-containing protein [Vicinamibacterales bacterium]
MTLRIRALLTASVFFAVAAVLPAQQPPPSFRSAVEAVEIDAFVTDRAGNVVPDLKQNEFQILEDGKPQQVTSFSLVNIPIAPPAPYSPTAAEPDVATNTRGEGRLYVIAFDEVHPVNALKARSFLRQFIEEHFETTDIAIVVSVGRARAGDMQDFTSNRRLLLSAIDRFGGGFPEMPQGGSDPVFEPLQQSGDARSQTRALRDLVESLASIQGRRKAVIYVTQKLHEPLVWDAVDYKGGVRSIQFDDMRAAMTAAMRGGVAFYTVDPSGLCGLECPGGADELDNRSALSELAAATGGFAVLNTNRFAESFERMVIENSTYYVLGYTSTNDKRDGRYRRLDLKVTRPGLTVRHRDGYIAPSKNEPTRKEPPERSTLAPAVRDLVRTPLASAHVPMSVFATALRGTGRESNVVIAVEIDPTRLDLSTGPGATTGQVEVAAVAISAGGKIAGGQRERFMLNLKPDTWERTKTAGLRLVTGMSLPPGRYQLRVAGGNVASLDAGSVMYDLDVPDFGKGALTMSAPLLASPGGSETFTVAPATRVRADLPLSPTTRRDFAAGDTLSIYAEIYDNSRDRDRHAVDLSAELRDESGRTVRRITGHHDAAPGGRHAVSLMLPMDAPAGNYLLHVEATANSNRVVRDVPIRLH